jgi:hypothetical protein
VRTQALEGPAHLDLDRLDGYAKARRDLRVRQVGDPAEGENPPTPWGQRIQRALDFQCGQEVRFAGRGGISGIHPFRSESKTKPLVLHVIERTVAGRREQIRAHGARDANAGAIGPDREKEILHQILGHRLVADIAGDERRQARGEFAEQRLVSRRVHPVGHPYSGPIGTYKLL